MPSVSRGEEPDGQQCAGRPVSSLSLIMSSATCPPEVHLSGQSIKDDIASMSTKSAYVTR